MYTHRKFDSQNGPFEPESSFTGIKFQEKFIPKTALLSQKEALRESNFKRYGKRRSIHIGNLIPKTAISSQKAALRESNFKRYCRRQIYTHRKFDSQNGPFMPESSFTGIKFQEVW